MTTAALGRGGAQALVSSDKTSPYSKGSASFDSIFIYKGYFVAKLKLSMYLRSSKNVKSCPELSKLSVVVQVSRLIAKEAEMATGNSTSKRGFASMDEERQREIASKGGKSVPAEKRSFSQDRELASEAGRKGGQASGSTRNPQD
jgi:uncharacterized protein